MIIDHTHFKTKDGIVFTTRGFYHPKNKNRAIPLYRPLLESKSLEKSVDEFGDKWIYQLHPEWIEDSPFGKGIFVPSAEILEIYDPFKSKAIIQKLKDKTAIKIISFLKGVGIKESDIGFLGSYLFNTGKKPNDVDFVIRGSDNLNLIKKNFKELLDSLDGQNFPSEEYVRKSIPRYEEKYNKEFNDFSGIIKRRWPTLYIPNDFFGKLRFTYKSREIPNLIPPKGRVLSNETISGEVVNDFGTNFMPRNFQIELKDKSFNILTYFWDFSYCVKQGDVVNIRGNYYPESNLFLLSDPKQHGIRFKG